MRGAAAAGPILGERLEVAWSTPTLQELWRQNIGRQGLPVLSLQVEVEGPEHGTDLCAGGVRRDRCSLGRGGLGQSYQQHPGHTGGSSSSQGGPPRRVRRFCLAALAAFRTFFPAVAFCLGVGIATPAILGHELTASFEELDGTLMLLGCSPSIERPEVPPLAGLGILLLRVQAVLA